MVMSLKDYKDAKSVKKLIEKIKSDLDNISKDNIENLIKTIIFYCDNFMNQDMQNIVKKINIQNQNVNYLKIFNDILGLDFIDKIYKKC